MSRKISSSTAPRHDDWAALISEVILANGRPPGGNWKTVAEIARESGLSEVRTSAIALTWLKLGRAERVSGRSDTGRRVNYFRPIISGTKKPH